MPSHFCILITKRNKMVNFRSTILLIVSNGLFTPKRANNLFRFSRFLYSSQIEKLFSILPNKQYIKYHIKIWKHNFILKIHGLQLSMWKQVFLCYLFAVLLTDILIHSTVFLLLSDAVILVLNHFDWIKENGW